MLDIERYPEFVPGYLRAQVLRRGTDTLEVEQSVGVGPATVTFRSHAEFAPLQRIANEAKQSFLTRARDAALAVAQ